MYTAYIRSKRDSYLVDSVLRFAPNLVTKLTPIICMEQTKKDFYGWMDKTHINNVKSKNSSI